MADRASSKKCCRATPRCRSCPLRTREETLRLEGLGLGGEPSLPPHLQGVPACLHKYEPLLRRSWLDRQPAAT